MASLFVLLKAAPEQEQHVHFAWKLAGAAAAAGHSVTLFALADGIYNLVTNLGGAHHDLGPVEPAAGAEGSGRFAIMYCHYNAQQRGVDSSLREGAESSATSQAGVMIGRSDRFLTIVG